MNAIRFSWMVLLAGVLIQQAVTAALPEGAQVVQAEEMTLNGSGWRVRDHDDQEWYTGRSYGQMLSGKNGEQGSASVILTLPAGGRHRVWIRHLDMLTHRARSGFVLTAEQVGRHVVRTVIGAEERSPRATPEGAKKWGDNYARWIWSVAEFDAAAGPLQLTVDKLHAVPVSSCTRCLDVLVVTTDVAYEPRVTDLAPFYLKVRMLPEQIVPVVIHFWGRRPFEPWYTDHANINRKGVVRGTGAGAEDKPGIRIAPGEESPWVDVSPYLAYGGLNQISLYAMRVFAAPETEAAFEVMFSKTPSEEGLMRREVRRGKGDGCQFAIDLSSYRLVTEREGSEASLVMAKAVPQVPGKSPEVFPFFTGMKLSEARSTRQAVENEREALRLIGIGGLKKWPSHFYFHMTAAPGCLGQPDHARMDAMFAGVAREHPDRSGWTAVNLMDEPGFDFTHVAACKSCQKGFAPFLERVGVPADMRDVLTLNNSPDGTNVQQMAAYYYTRRYMNHLMTEMLRAGHASAQRHMPGVPTTVNFACELLDGNLVSRSVDWFEILGSGALTYGWHEDWGGWARTRQVNGYYVDVMRAACRAPGVAFGIYNILCRTPWEIQARAFLEFGHGVRAMHFFNYGPYYAITSDANSHRPEIYEAIKRVTFAMGAVERDVLAGRPARGDVAQLLSVSGDIWYATRDNVFGKERTWLHLLLRHCGVSCDVLHEDEIPASRVPYRVLFANDAHLKRAALMPLVTWVRSGGVLVLGAGALTRDELGAPLGLDEALGLTRAPLALRDQPGRAEYEMLRLKPLGEHRGMPLLCGTNAPLEHAVASGRGRVVLTGFFPGISYVATSKRPDAAEYSALDFEAAHRTWMARLLEANGVRPRIRVTPYNVEVNLLESPEADVLAVSNWTGKRAVVTVEVDRTPGYRAVEPVTGRLVEQSVRQQALCLTLEVGAGDLVRLVR
ncbi:MAG TPA: hypothetical protein PLU38_06800 [Kiritimatiellia bacterium]|nr:hypothetical protein [Kiritimatiellia bacterium]HQQ91557.1 hypothetical protein [Kiritimatiellia bacterium]